jgi:hypothetical protein
MGKAYKLFISQPMVDKTNEQIEAERARIMKVVQEKLKEKLQLGYTPEVELLDSFFKDAPHDAKPLWFLGKSFEILSSADVVYFGGEWAKYRGCTMENMAAKKYLEPTGVVIIEE